MNVFMPTGRPSSYATQCAFACGSMSRPRLHLVAGLGSVSRRYGQKIGERAWCSVSSSLSVKMTSASSAVAWCISMPSPAACSVGADVADRATALRAKPSDAHASRGARIGRRDSTTRWSKYPRSRSVRRASRTSRDRRRTRSPPLRRVRAGSCRRAARGGKKLARKCVGGEELRRHDHEADGLAARLAPSRRASRSMRTVLDHRAARVGASSNAAGSRGSRSRSRWWRSASSAAATSRWCSRSKVVMVMLIVRRS